MSDAVLLIREGAAMRLTLNRPDTRNALSPVLVEAMMDALGEVEQARPRGLIVAGAGPVFCAGLDLTDLDRKSDGDMLHLLLRIELMLQRLWSLPCRTLGLAQKAAFGAGADILVACQTRVLTQGGKMAFPGLGFGVFLGTNRLGLRIGPGPAERLLAAGRPIPAATALDCGLVDAVAAEGGLTSFSADWTESVAKLEPHVAANLGVTAVRADGAADIEALVRSASRPGLRDRIAAYAAAQSGMRADAANQKRETA
ncbi:MAG: enoyl-CoA hydratase/isomerase family protein [Hyphomicrobiales bacterium]|nr:enoyl-CoA hydratase/isomerase family protein [Hyphomicrobiales bacterium]